MARVLCTVGLAPIEVGTLGELSDRSSLCTSVGRISSMVLS